MTADEQVDFTRPADPLLRHARLDHCLELPVLGLRTRFESNSRHVMRTIEQAFGGWRCAGPAYAPDRPLSVRVIVHDGVEHGPHPVPVRHIAPDSTRVIAHTPGSVAMSDPDRQEAVAYVTAELAGQRDHFREAILEAIALALLSHFDRHPIHAAAIARDDTAVLLAGPSGIGKSTLARIADDANLDVLSEDRVWIQLEPVQRVWGWPGHARILTADGTRKTIVQLSGADRASCYSAARAVPCLLARGVTAALDRLDEATVLGALTRDVAPGFDRFPERHDVVSRALAAGGGWRLTLSADPREALPLLERMLDQR